ncbi:hypothetical protein JTE90_000197 [Oedothorax gibbosus]|uniref:SEC14-like protein 2 n=1 Tax=Oedothorax gibbosus TaxID=931172 RepID=A0AAV6TSD6_9ARAC|nr:hypothetical protein JTE90_000197 [Oedothorax gibbosus]
MEETQVEELRRRLKGKMSSELYNDDNMFIRFLRARGHNVDAAENMLKNHIKWRNEIKYDTILTDYTPHKFAKTAYFSLSRMGNDLEEAPVSLFHFGNLDSKGMVKSIKTQDMELYAAYYLEKKVEAMKEVSAKTGKHIDKWVLIFDFENFSLASATHKPTLEFFGALTSLYEGNFPERLKTAYIINNSYYFSLFWAVLKPILSPSTATKFHILGKTGWQEELLKAISPDVLPVYYGGNRTDPDGDPMCKSVFANQTGSARIPGAKKLTVARSSKSEVPVHVPSPGSTLDWEFTLMTRDIGFGLLYKDHRKTEAVIPQQRIETSEATESGMFKCEKSGTYIIEFDNTFSWLHSKEIYYTFKIFQFSIGRLPILPLSAASSPSLYRPPPLPPSIGRLLTLPLSAASSPSLYRPPPSLPHSAPSLPSLYRPPSSPSHYRPPPLPPSIGRLLNLPLSQSAAFSPSLYRPPPHPPSIGRLLTLPLSAASSPSLYRPPPHPPTIGRLLSLPLSAASSTSHYPPTQDGANWGEPPTIAIGRLLTLPLSAASSPSLYRPPPHPPTIGRLLSLPLSAASSTSHYRNRPPSHPPSIGRLLTLPLSAASSPSLYRPPPHPPSIDRLLNLPLSQSAASSPSLHRSPPQPPFIGRLLNLPLSAASSPSHYRSIDLPLSHLSIKE